MPFFCRGEDLWIVLGGRTTSDHPILTLRDASGTLSSSQTLEQSNGTNRDHM